MKLHGNARTCPHSRLLLCRRMLEQRWSLTRAAEAAGVSERTAAKWLGRYRAEGEAGLADRSSAPGEVANRTAEERIELLAALRRLRMTAAEIAELLAMPVSTVSGILTRIGLGRLTSLEPLEPPNRYERERPGELVHIDVKKLGRISGAGHRMIGSRASQRKITANGRRIGASGWEYVHVCVDDATRLAYVEVLDDEKATTAIAFLRRAVAHFAAFGIRVERVMTDNGSAYRATIHALACRALGIKHLRTRPYRPRTNGKAERCIQTLTRKWARGRLYANSAERTAALDAWLDHYNYTRPHGSLGHKPPGSRLTKAPGNYS
jgi:transposase InsO family protein